MQYVYDNKVITGDSYQDLVDCLKNGGAGWQSDLSREEYMKKFSDRYSSIMPQESPIDISSEESFINSLAANKLVRACHTP